tara:strand:+ start:1634 stop:3052 length:1419 start_codon:yes stop_codon:yes gene_type:complete
MVFPVVGGDGKPTGYDITNSIRFNDDNEAYLSKTFGTATNRKIWTYSFWVKRGNLGTQQCFLGADAGSGTNNNIRFRADNAITFFAQGGGSDIYYLNTNQVFRDTSSWYHLVFVFNSTESTSTNRLKMYVNGSQVTSFSSTGYPSLNLEDTINSNVAHEIGRRGSANMPADFYMAETHFIDGQALTPTSFGETDDNGVWIPKEYDGTYGNNGFFLEYKQTGTSANASGKGADTSGEGNHFDDNNMTVEDITTDTPTNNFATMNPLDNYYAGMTFSEGNCKVVTGSSPSTFNTSTIGVANGKWYWEVKIIDKATGSDQTSIGVQGGVSPGTTDQMGYNTRGIQVRSNGNTHTNGSNSTYMAAQNDNDIVMVAFDKDNDNVYFGANGQWGDGSGNTDEANPTSAKSISVAAGEFVFAALGDMTGSDTCTYEINFGNPSFSISSGNADANGYGNFEYAVPSGYYSLCTKNLATYG